MTPDLAAFLDKLYAEGQEFDAGNRIGLIAGETLNLKALRYFARSSTELVQSQFSS